MRPLAVRALLVFAVSIASVSTAASPARADLTPAPVLATETLPYATLLRTINPHLALAQSAAYAQALLAAARRFHLDPNLVVALVTVESSWRPSVSSIHGARGLGQLLPGTARDLGVNAWSGRENLKGTALYLHQLLGTFHGSRDPVREALAGYNAGPAAVRAAGGTAPTYESQHYVVKVMHALAMVRSRVARLFPGLAASPDDALFADAAAGVAPTQRDLDRALEALDAAQAQYWGSARGAAASTTEMLPAPAPPEVAGPPLPELPAPVAAP